MKLREYSVVSRWLPIALLFVAVAIGSTLVPPHKANSTLKTMLIDDFSSVASKKNFGTNWQFVSDRVIGGVSSGKIEFVKDDDRSSMHMTGAVSLANNGGFIQARTGFNPEGRSPVHGH